MSDWLWLPTIFFIGMPYGVLVAARPVIRAGILYTGFHLLRLGGGESAPFVIIVMADMGLYYSSLLWPNWSGHPSKKLAASAFFKKRSVHVAGGILFIFYTALICTCFVMITYSDVAKHKANGETLIMLLFFWYLLTLYVRMDFLSNNIDHIWKSIRAMPVGNLLLGLLTLSISFIGFMWRYWFGWV